MAKLTDGVVVRHPDTGEVTFLAAGSELPSWAKDLVGDHVLEKNQPPPRKAASSKSE